MAFSSMFILASSARRGKENVWSQDQYAESGQERATELGARTGITWRHYSTVNNDRRTWAGGRDGGARATIAGLSRAGRSGPSTSFLTRGPQRKIAPLCRAEGRGAAAPPPPP